jgi:5-methylcytosine-specific restriction endonuclease McrA
LVCGDRKTSYEMLAARYDMMKHMATRNEVAAGSIDAASGHLQTVLESLTRLRVSLEPDPRAKEVLGVRTPVPRGLRELVLSAGRCATCGSKDDLTVDHIMPISKGGTHERTNLQCLCRKCNEDKSDYME